MDIQDKEEEEDDDGDIAAENKEGGKYWRLQLHWPATPKSSISCIKVDPIDTHNVSVLHGFYTLPWLKC